MEVLKHIEGDNMNPTRIKRIYETWMRRIGSMKKWPVEVFQISSCVIVANYYNAPIYSQYISIR